MSQKEFSLGQGDDRLVIRSLDEGDMNCVTKSQVWPPIIFFCFLVNNHWITWRANKWPLNWDDIVLFCSSQKLSSSRSLTLEGLLELAKCTYGPSASPRMLLPEQQKIKDTVRSGVLLGQGVPGYLQEQLTQILIIICFVKTKTFIQWSVIVKSQQIQNRIELVTRPASPQLGTTCYVCLKLFDSQAERAEHIKTDHSDIPRKELSKMRTDQQRIKQRKRVQV